MKIFAPAFFTLIIAASIFSCKQKSISENQPEPAVAEEIPAPAEKKTEEAAPQSMDIALIKAAWADSVVFTEHNAAKVSVSTVFPEKTGTAVEDSIGIWICRTLGDSDGKLRDRMKELVEQNGTAQLRTDSSELAAFMVDGPDFANYECLTDISKSFENGEYLTLVLTIYSYRGGAHGSTFIRNATFRKSDGHLMDWDLLADMEEAELRERIKQGLLRYFEVDDFNQLFECLMIGSGFGEAADREIFDNKFPLPTNPPFLTEEGVAVMYGQYEIASYAAGMPTGIVKAL